jgi:phosphinothricin acetyltransferase
MRTKADCLLRPAADTDAGAIASIYNEGIRERVATFLSEPQSAADVAPLLDRSGSYPVLVAEVGGSVAGWTAVKPYSDFAPYRPVAECTLYVTRAQRRRGIARALLNGLADAAERAGFTKLIGKVFTDNLPSIALVKECDFREVGVHERHGRLDGRWKDVLLVERLLGEAGGEATGGPSASRRLSP